MLLYEEYSHNNQYKFEVRQANVISLQILSYQKEYRSHLTMEGMEKPCATLDEAIKTGRALLAILEEKSSF